MAEACQNPLLAGWLKERWDIERERGTKAAPTYKKAYESILKCPLKFKHPSEAQNLSGIGPNIVNNLTKKLQEHCEANGLPMPTKARKDAKRRAERANLGQPDQEPSPERPAKKQRTAKTYIPKLRSGGYGIIIALSKVSDDERGISKDDLIPTAQPYCESSYTVPSDPKKFFTAWKSMETLMEKELVCSLGGRVKRYLLTDEGWEVAKKIQSAESGLVDSPGRRKPEESSTSARQIERADQNGIHSSEAFTVQNADIPRPTNKYTAIAAGIVQEATTAARLTDRHRLGIASPTLPVNKFTALAAGIVRDATAAKSKRQQLPTVAAEREGVGLPSPKQGNKSAVPEVMDLTSTPESSPRRPMSKQGQITTSASTLTNKPLKTGYVDPARNSLTTKPNQSTDNSIPPSFKPVILPVGSFEVRLVLDNREVRTKQDRDYISSNLKAQGVTPITRSLELGDALWIAEIKPPYDGIFLAEHPDDEGEGKTEVVLDYIMERKRYDDLLGSIKDGRFHEQKFRLRKSGAKNVIYLIEEYSLSDERMDKYGEALDSAIAGMQMVNGFFVKQTSKLDETIAYLTSMTAALKGIYEQRELKIIPSKVLDGQKYAPMMAALRTKEPETDYYITFNAFNWMCTKSNSLTLRDIYLQMLMVTKGVTGEKAMEIQKRWPTPRALVEAYESTDGEEAKATLISGSLGGLITRKKIARTLSASIAMVWA